MPPTITRLRDIKIEWLELGSKATSIYDDFVKTIANFVKYGGKKLETAWSDAETLQFSYLFWHMRAIDLLYDYRAFSIIPSFLKEAKDFAKNINTIRKAYASLFRLEDTLIGQSKSITRKNIEATESIPKLSEGEKIGLHWNIMRFNELLDRSLTIQNKKGEISEKEKVQKAFLLWKEYFLTINSRVVDDYYFGRNIHSIYGQFEPLAFKFLTKLGWDAPPILLKLKRDDDLEAELKKLSLQKGTKEQKEFLSKLESEYRPVRNQLETLLTKYSVVDSSEVTLPYATNANLITQSKASEDYEIPTSTLSKYARQGKIWSGKEGRNRYHKRQEIQNLSQSRSKTEHKF